MMPIIHINLLIKMKKVYRIVMEYMEGSTLQKLLDRKKPIDEGLVRKVLSQVAKAINWLHNNMLYTQDVKPENIMLEQSRNSSSASGSTLKAKV
uniref:Protein kinase domain-containing protein n=1 Tax=Ditylenchus dipsaci TaxID=166011 RepID=A0A915DK80_9BILA